jgi:hypothetical protein
MAKTGAVMDKTLGWEVPEVLIEMYEGTRSYQVPPKHESARAMVFTFVSQLVLGVVASGLTAVAFLWKDLYNSSGPLGLALLGLMVMVALAFGATVTLLVKVVEKSAQEERRRTNFEYFLLEAQRMLGLGHGTWLDIETGQLFTRAKLEKLARKRLLEMGEQIVSTEHIRGFLNSPTLNKSHAMLKSRFEDAFHWLQRTGFIPQDDDYGTYIKDSSR